MDKTISPPVEDYSYADAANDTQPTPGLRSTWMDNSSKLNKFSKTDDRRIEKMNQTYGAPVNPNFRPSPVLTSQSFGMDKDTFMSQTPTI